MGLLQWLPCLEVRLLDQKCHPAKDETSVCARSCFYYQTEDALSEYSGDSAREKEAAS
jgi:hypothetical protein